MSDDDKDGLISVAAAQRKLAERDTKWSQGRPGLKLLRYLRGRERALKIALIVRGEGTRRSWYRVSWFELRRQCPELFNAPRARVKPELQESLERLIDARVRLIISEYVEPKLRELFDRDSTLERLVQRGG